MKTAFGSDCSYYYEDLHRGRELRECRLLHATRDNWSYKMCQRCPVPRWQQSNSCEHQLYSGTATRGFLSLGSRMVINVWCDRAGTEVSAPEVGCGQCHLDNPVMQALHYPE